MESLKIYEELKQILRTLSDNSYNGVLSILDQIELSHLLCIKLWPGSLIFRTRPSEKKEFTQVKQLSFNQHPKRYGRAHRLGFPMFYGSFATSENEDSTLTNYAEVLEIFRDKESNQDELKITCGRWEVEKEIIVALMIFNRQYLKKNSQFMKLYTAYIKRMSQVPQNKDFLMLLELISDEFAKGDIAKDHEYIISAAFNEMVIQRSKNRIQGILYPSVRCEGENFNVAIAPLAVNECLRLSRVVTQTLYVKDKHVINDFNKQAEVDWETRSFNLEDITNQKYHKGKEQCMNILDNIIKLNKRPD